MRVLIVSDSYPPLIGGATRSAQQLAHHLTARGHDVTVATSWQADTPAEEDDGGVQVHRLRGLTSRVPALSADPHRHTPPPFPDPETVWRFRRLLKQVDPEIIHTYGWISYSCLAALVGRRIPIVLAARDYGNVCAVRTLVRHGEVCDGPAWGKCVECASATYGRPKGFVAVVGTMSGRWLLRRKVHGLHTVSTYVQEVMRRHLKGSRQWPEAVIPDFRDQSADGEPDPAILRQLPEEPFMLFVGALRKIKGVDELLEAYQRLTSPPALVLIGTQAPDSPASFPAGVTVIYGVPHATVMAAWDRALFGVAPSTLPEPLGNVVHEAMSRGKAVIGSTPGGHVDMIGASEEAGLLVPAGDVAALTAAMRRLLDDPVLREGMGRTALVRARAFTAEVAVPRFDELFDRVVAAAGKR